jgi:long-chain acyl-CoA synthetase
MIGTPSGAFAQAVQQLARDAPDRIAIHAPEEREPVITRARLWTRAADARAALDAAGLARGSVVLWMAGNAAGFYSLLVASMDAGVVLLLADQTTPAELLHEVESLWGVAGRVVRAAAADGPGADLPGDLRLVPSRGHGLRYLPCAAVVKLTSGSVGTPRGVAIGEAHLWDDVTRIIEAMGIEDRDVHLASIPITHSYGLGNLVLPVLALGCTVVLRAARRPPAFAADTRLYGVTAYPATPHIFDYLLDRCRSGVEPSVRLLISAGAPLRQSTIARALDAWRLKIHSFYGTTETGGIAYDVTADLQEEGYVGRPLPRTSVDLRPSERSGRILVRSDSVASGYISPHPAPDGGEFAEGGFLTADIGSRAGDGSLRLLGRVTDAINVAGLKVDPAEVETVLRLAPGVSAACVVGVPCPAHGQDVVAVLAARKDVRWADLETFCRVRLSRHKVPRSFVVLDRLPLNRRGKVDRGEIGRHLATHVCKS